MHPPAPVRFLLRHRIGLGALAAVLVIAAAIYSQAHTASRSPRHATPAG